MTLIICDECGKKYSSNAKACPECANPTPKVIEEAKVEEPKVEVKPVKKEKKPVDGVKLSRILIGISSALFLILHAFNFYFGRILMAIQYNEIRESHTVIILSGSYTIVFFHIILLAAVILLLISAFKKNKVISIISSILFMFAGGFYFITEAYYMSTYLRYISFIAALGRIFKLIVISITPCLFGGASILTLLDFNKYKDKAKLNITSILSLVLSIIVSLNIIIAIIINIISFFTRSL